VVSIGLPVTLPLLVLESPTQAVEASDLAWLALAGAGYVTGLVLNDSALAGGKVPVTAPIVSTEGVVAASIAVLAGEPAPPLLLAMLALVAVGVFVTVLEPGGGFDALSGDGARYVGFAIIAATVVGLGLYALGRASSGGAAQLGRGGRPHRWRGLHHADAGADASAALRWGGVPLSRLRRPG
jgi:hypothetical protein